MNQVGWKKCEKINENWMNKFQSEMETINTMTVVVNR